MFKGIKSLATLVLMGVPVWVIVAGLMGRGTASLVVHVEEPGVTVWVGGRDYAARGTATDPIEVEPGEQLLRVTKDGETLFAEGVVVDPGERKEVWARWEPAEAETEAEGPAVDLGEERSRLGAEFHVNAVGIGGRYGMAADEAGSLQLWDLAENRAGRVIKAHHGRIDALAVCDDGRCALSVSNDGKLRVWDLADGREVRTIPLAEGAKVSTLAVTPDGRLAATGDEHASVRVIEVASGREILHHEVEKASAGALAFSADGSVLVVGLVGGRHGPHPVDVLDVASGRLARRMIGHSGPVWGVACLPDGRRAVSVSGDRTLRIWDLVTGRELKRMGNNPGAGRCLAVSPDGRTAVVGTGHRWAGGWKPARTYGVQVWDLTEGRSLGRFATGSPVCSVALSADGRRALAADEDQVIRSWDMPGAVAAPPLSIGAAVPVFGGASAPVDGPLAPGSI